MSSGIGILSWLGEEVFSTLIILYIYILVKCSQFHSHETEIDYIWFDTNMPICNIYINLYKNTLYEVMQKILRSTRKLLQK